MKENSTPLTELSFQRLLSETQAFASDEPLKAFAIAGGAGLLFSVLPTRVIVGSAAAIAVALVRPALLTLGLLKAFELTCPQSSSHTPT